MNNSNYFEAMRELWLTYGGEPDEELHPEDYGRYMSARMAEARRPDSKLSEFDEWARRERREQEEADDLHGVRVALERIAAVLEHGDDTPQPEATRLMNGVGLDPEPTIEGAYVRKPSIELHRGLDGFGGVYRDDAGGSWFALDLDQELRADSPEDLRDIAELFRDEFADALEWAADEWQEQLDADTVSLLPPESMNDDIADEDNEEED
ncbi:hypothetical protein PG2093B_0335 [Bifidobacterium pseudolongum subsp. globosum]|uniref:Uncharacterized protein n=1 Tax=Bifidobacterium pseudolongum subsp. globosum TaxID=1690 RepID=A0A4Q5A1W6_9BIFI|nr:hypothetical protein [Bifidobacterium pseudolongum]RYQ11651.1 hypothetical protein PG2093B_0335 [Bifidobacterium pseudolongum subsp. globosum]